MHVYEQTENGIESRHYTRLVTDPSRTRPTRITDYRKWLKEGKDVYPSVTTVLSIFDKPGLNNWKVDQHLETAFKQQLVSSEIRPSKYLKGDLWDVDAYKRDIKSLTEHCLAEAPDKGTEIHDYLEAYIRGGSAPDLRYWSTEDALEVALQVETALEENCGDPDWVCEEAFAHELGFAGRVDLHGWHNELTPRGSKGTPWVVDFKTTKNLTSGKKKKLAYKDSHCIQLAAYREGLGLPHARCANVFISTEEPGLVEWHEWTEDELSGAWGAFQHALELWRWRNDV